MCGIFGLIRHSDNDIPRESLLGQTAQLMRHRGPDGHGIFADPGVGLVHTRLSLLDLNERSNQPFWDRERRHCLVYNGEIYNFQQLRDRLAKAGIEFRTTCDTEVLLEALLHWGPETTLPELEGMFAFGFYDRQTKSLLLARDRFGIKPLFVVDAKDQLIFSSEVRALRPWIEFKPDLPSIDSFLSGFSGPTLRGTFLEGVHYLEPGMFLTIKKGSRPEYRRFFDLTEFVDDAETEKSRGFSDRQRIDLVDQRMHDSVKAHLLADAPVGSLCSGGIDSSIIIAIAKHYHNNLAIFHANVVGKLSEYDAAAELARHLKLDIKSVDIRSQDFLERIPEVIDHYGLPFHPRPHSIPFRMVSSLAASNGVKALLSGEGADECFLGYSYLAPDIRSALRPRAALRRLRQWARRQAPAAESSYVGLSYVGGLDPRSTVDLVLAMGNRFEVLEEARAVRTNLASGRKGKQRLGLLQSFDLLHYNLRSALLRNDFMGMMASIECRFPFLDNNLVRTSLNLPYKDKIRFSPMANDPTHPFFCDKWIIRKVGERYLPESLTRRQKKPFWVDAYGPGRLVLRHDYFSDSFVEELFHLSAGEKGYLLEQASHELRVKLMQLEVWAEVCLHGTPHENSVNRLKKHISISDA